MASMKKLNLIISHSDITDVINELMYLECFEPLEPEVKLEPPELAELVKREVMELESYEANFEEIVVFTTQYTYILAGWVPDDYERDLTISLSKFICAWDLENPNPDNYDVPILLNYPWLFGKFRSGGRNVFEPLVKAQLY
ncbi:MAG: hypothetical protein LBC73_01905 [Oscillospiraceae bacterium]|jgi:vacuolar-type H+-ATPase subunit I/STV1|nr:hypothetical protein [Oscillospiraceae bacterium]